MQYASLLPTYCTVVVSSRVSTGSQGLPWILERRTTGAPPPFASVWRHVHACARRAWALARTRRPVFPDRRAAEAGAVQIKQKRFSAPVPRLIGFGPVQLVIHGFCLPALPPVCIGVHKKKVLHIAWRGAIFFLSLCCLIRLQRLYHHPVLHCCIAYI